MPASFTEQFLDALSSDAPGTESDKYLRSQLFCEGPWLGPSWRAELNDNPLAVQAMFQDYLLKHCQGLGNDIILMTDRQYAQRLQPAQEKPNGNPVSNLLKLVPHERILTNTIRLDVDHITQMPDLLFRAVDNISKGMRNGLQSVEDLAIAIPCFYLDRRAFLVELFAYATLFVREKLPLPL